MDRAERIEAVMGDAAAHEGWMRAALAEARASAAEDEVPVGAVVVSLDDGRVVGRGRDRKIAESDPTSHAEIVALRQAAGALGDWRLESHALVVTLEPCPMCAGAALLARVPLLIYGADNFKFGACGARHNLYDPAIGWNHTVAVVKGVLAEECGAILSEYFAAKRRK